MTPLLNLLADGEFHTGPSVADQLGVSRAAINLQVQAARARGITIESVRSRGYRLPGGAQWLDAGKLTGSLRRTFKNVCVDVYESIPGTNAQLMQGQQPWPELQFAFAEHQSAGRGRRGRVWVSPWGNNIYFSCAIRYHDGVPAHLSLQVGVALAQLLSRSGVAGVGLKWPNDLWVAEHKCGGILVEVQGDPMGECRAIIGVGLNLKTSAVAAAQIDQPYADLRNLGLDPAIDRTLLSARAARAVAQAAQASNPSLATQFAKWDCLRGKLVRASGSHGAVQGTACGLSDDGGLIIETEQGPQIVHSGEVSVRTHA